ncbi:unnamed protein product [Phytomonas sp. Hart1]|nr:unnamed protein product [Phytomonas sp. Hart1]|eukprot:CCW71936.1 unnamed protein product [Phytomonas sp. isolate Hart1]
MNLIRIDGNNKTIIAADNVHSTKLDDVSIEEVIRAYWNLRELVRKDEGRLIELQSMILLVHNAAWNAK